MFTKFGAGDFFCKGVGGKLMGRQVLQSQFLVEDQVSHKVESKIHVPGAVVLDFVGGNGPGAFVVGEKGD